MNKKVMFVVTNRSSYNKVKTVVLNLNRSINPIFLLGGGANLYRYAGIVDIIQRDFRLTPTRSVHMAVDGDDLAKMPKTVGVGLIELSTIFDNEQVDGVVTVADRFETMATALAASYMNIPLIHIQGGERTGTIDNRVRNAITQLADIHFPATLEAACNIDRMLCGSSRPIYTCGCPSMDLLVHYDENYDIRNSRQGGCIPNGISKELASVKANQAINTHGTGSPIDVNKDYLIVILHGDTTDDNFVNSIHALPGALRKIDAQKIIFWNNIDPYGEHIAKMWRECRLDNTRYVRHIEPEDFGAVLLLSKCVVGNSSTGIRECSFLGVPSVNIGHRQMGRERSDNCITVMFYENDIVDAITSQMQATYLPSDLYGKGDAGRQIAWRIGDVLCRK